MMLQAAFVLAVAIATTAHGLENPALEKPALGKPGLEIADSQYDELIPRYLLGLVHAPEVHSELKLAPEQVTALETFFRELDAVWFPSRLLSADKQAASLRVLEEKVWDWFRDHTSVEQQKRLQQLEYYAQSGRMLLRDDVSKRIGLQATQLAKLAELARATDVAQQKLSRSQFGDPEIAATQATLTENVKAERAALAKFVRPEQRQKLSDLLGPAFDPTKLKRIYAMAPEFIEVKHWVNCEPLTIRELKGKVVIVQFYAFQCHNCHANFGIYQRWHKELSDKGVVVVGIQTPETSAEREPAAVKAAAAERRLDFPILVDLESKNWAAWGNTMWPTVYVVDKNGYIRHWWQGELNWQGATADKTIEDIVDGLLAEKM